MKESRIKDINLHIERFKSTQQIKERPTLSTIYHREISEHL